MTLSTAKSTVALRELTAKFDTSMKSAKPFYPSIAAIAPSTGADEKYAWLGQMPGVREWLGDRQFKELRAATYALPNKHWEDSLLIAKNDIKDDQLGMYGMLLEQLGIEAAHHPDELLMSLVVDGETNLCFDGQAFFDTDHSWGDSGTQSNDLTYDAASTSAVTVSEFKSAFRQAVDAIFGFKGDNGKYFHRPVLETMTGLVVLVPRQLRGVAHDAMDSDLLGGGDSNIVIDRPRIVASPYLTDATKFYVFMTDTPLKPFVFQARQPISRQMTGMDDIEFKDVKFMTEARYNVGYLFWWNAVLTTFT